MTTLGPLGANMTTLVWRGDYAALVYRFKAEGGSSGWTFSVFYRQHVMGGEEGSMEFGTPDPGVCFWSRETALRYAEDELDRRAYEKQRTEARERTLRGALRG